MQYNDQKKQVYETIKKVLMTGKEIDRNALYLEAMERFGLGKLTVDRYINTLLEGGYVTVKDDKIKWKK